MVRCFDLTIANMCSAATDEKGREGTYLPQGSSFLSIGAHRPTPSDYSLTVYNH